MAVLVSWETGLCTLELVYEVNGIQEDLCQNRIPNGQLTWWGQTACRFPMWLGHLAMMGAGSIWMQFRREHNQKLIALSQANAYECGISLR